MTESATPEVDARATWRKDHEEMGSYRLNGRCINCEGKAVGIFTKGYRSHENRNVACPHCGCVTMGWKGLTEDDG